MSEIINDPDDHEYEREYERAYERAYEQAMKRERLKAEAEYRARYCGCGWTRPCPCGKDYGLDPTLPDDIMTTCPRCETFGATLRQHNGKELYFVACCVCGLRPPVDDPTPAMARRRWNSVPHMIESCD